MTNIRISYSKKLLFLLLVISLVPLVSLSVILYVDKTETESNILKNQLNSISETGSQKISEIILNQKNIVNSIAQTDTIVTITKKLSHSNIEKDEYFENRYELENKFSIFSNTFPELKNFIISNAKTGEILFYSDLRPPEKNLKNQKHFQEAITGRVELSEIFLSSNPTPNEFGDFEINVPTFFISSPIQGEVGTEGILTVEINFLKINSIAQSNDFYTVDSYLINSEGYFLSKPKFIGDVIKSDLIKTRPELNLQIMKPNSNQFTEIFKLSNSESTVLELNGYVNYLGNFVIGSITPVKETNWFYITEIEKNEAFSKIILIQILIFSIICIVLISLTGLAFYFTSTFTAPIRKLQTATEQIIKGNLDVKIATDSQDDIGELSRNFENMIENLKDTTDIEAQMLLQQNLRKALEASSIVSIIDQNGKIIYVNDKFCEVSKYSKEELIGKRQDILRSKMHPRPFYADLWGIISNGKIWHGEICNKAKDGMLFWNDTTIIPFFDKNGKIYEYVSVRIDITNQKNLTQKLVKSERLSAIGELASRLAHDLRNPLDVIKNTLYLVEPFLKQHPETSKNVVIFKRSVERIEHQINDVLNFIKEKPTIFDNYIVTDIIKNSLESLIIPDNIKITLKPSDIQFEVDSSQIEIVFTNLIRNSIEAIGEDMGTISIKVIKKQNKIIIEFVDSGVLNVDVDKIFEPLFTTKMTGTGLGLVSCKTIVKNHGGKMSVKSFPTTFTVIIPNTKK